MIFTATYKKDKKQQQKCSMYIFYILFSFSALSGNEITFYGINPGLTDHSIHKNLTKHHVYIPSDPKHYNNKLLVFLPGTGAKPAYYDQFNAYAARLGFHVIGLNYMNKQKLFKLCSKKPEGCYEKTCREIIDGVDRTPDINIKPVNSIKNRLLKLLKYLDNNYPDKSWEQFYSKERILWNKINLAGHSQGGELAGIIAKHNTVQRVIFFNSPNGITLHGNKRHKLAAWINRNNQTESKRYYGFYHKANTGQRKLRIYRILSMLKFGSEVNATKISTSDNAAHVVFSDFNTHNPHSAIVMDKYLPSSTIEKQMIKDAWKYLLLHTDEVPTKIEIDKLPITREGNLKEKDHVKNKIENLPLLYITL